MDKANIIISIIIVLCVAAAVAAYGITNSDNPIFSDLSSMSANDNDAGNGIGNNTVTGNGSGNTIATTSGSGSGSSSSSSSGSGSGLGSGGGSNSNSRTHLSYSEAKSIANDAIEEAGCYAGSGSYSGGYWYFTVYDANGNNVDTISVNDNTGATGRG